MAKPQKRKAAAGAEAKVAAPEAAKPTGGKARGKVAGGKAGGKANGKAPPQATSDPTSVFIRGLPKGTEDAELRRWLEESVGPTVTCFAIRDDYGLAKFKSEDDARRCLEDFQGAEFKGAKLDFKAGKKKRAADRSANTREGTAAATSATDGTSKATSQAASKTGGKLDLRTVQLRGAPAGVQKEEVQKWVEEQLPGGCGIEHVRRQLGDEASGTFIVTFRKEANAKRAVEALQGASLKGSSLSVGFRSLELSRSSAKAGRLIVRNLAFGATEKHVRKAFQEMGSLSDIHLPSKTNADGSKSHRGFAFLQFADAGAAQRAVSELNGVKICGRGVAVDWAVDAQLYTSLQREDQKQEGKKEAKKDGKKEKKTKAKAKAPSDEEDDDEGDEDEEEEEGAEDDDGKNEIDTEKEAKRNKKLLDGESDEDDDQDDEDEDDEEDDEENSDGDEHSKSKKAKKEKKAPRTPGFDLGEGRAIFVRNVPFEANMQDLREVFNKFGRVKFVKLVADQTGANAHRGTAFVHFVDKDGSEAALAAEAEADRKLKELSAVVKRSEQREVPAVDGFGICLKGRRLVVKEAVAPKEVAELAAERKNGKGSAKDERRQWLHLLTVGQVKEGSPDWEKLSKSEQRQRQASMKERKFRVNNPNFVLDPLRLSIRNLPTQVNVCKLREAVVKHLVEKLGDESKPKKERMQAVQDDILKASLVRDDTRRDANDERRSRGFGFIAFKDHKSAMAVLEHLNNNPKVFGGSRKPIVEFAIEDKRKLRMQQELYRKHAHKLLPEGKEGSAAAAADGAAQTAEKDAEPAPAKKGKLSEKKQSAVKRKRLARRAAEREAKAGAAGADASLGAGKAGTEEPQKPLSRGQRQRAKRREQKELAAEREAMNAVWQARKKKRTAEAREEKVVNHPKPVNKRHLPDAPAEGSKRARAQKRGEVGDDFELKAMERFRQAGF